MSNRVVCLSGFRLPGEIVAEDRVERRDHFAHAGHGLSVVTGANMNQPTSPWNILLSKHTRRREFIGALAGGFAGSTRGRAQGIRLVGALMAEASENPQAISQAATFLQALDSLGWREGVNFRVEWRWAAGDSDQMRRNAADLVNSGANLILAQGSLGVRAIQTQTRTVPVVFVLANDPVDQGFVASLSHPGGNITGFTAYEYEIGGKWLEVLKEIAPGTRRVLGLYGPDLLKGYIEISRIIEALAPKLATQFAMEGVKSRSEVENSIGEFASEPDGALMVIPSAITASQHRLIADLAARHRLPAIYGYETLAKAGGLISYGIDSVGIFKLAATYVDRVLRGASPGNLPVQAPTRYRLTVNLRTAKAIGLNIPESFLVRADEVIE